MKRILALFVFLGYFLLTYSLEYHEQVYYVAHGTLDRDTIRCVSFDVVNSNMEPIVILFTEDDLEKMNFEEVLYRKCYRRYGDFLSYINNKYTLDIDKSMLEFAYTTNEKLIGQIIQGGFYKDNRSLSDRIWSYGNQNGKDIQYILTKGMAEQKSYLEIIKDLEKFLKSNTDPDFKKTYTKLYNRKVDYNAQRLLRTAMNHMFYVQNVSNAKNNPYAEAMHWELSAEHGTRQVDRFGEDECDDYANSDYYNLGQGNFPPDKVPVPHPNCLCIQTIVIPKSLDEIGRELGEWINGKDISYLDEWLKVG